MATALIQFTQGAHTDAAGKAVLGVYGDFQDVTVTNGDNTGVVSWKIYLLDAPPDSATYPAGSQPQVLAFGTNNNTPVVDFSPDVAGTYRVMLEVSNSAGSVDRDIRCFGIPDARGFVRPPYQVNPEPLPIAVPGIITVDPRPTKPDEQNYSSNVRGWAGNGAVGQLDEFLRRYDDLPQLVVTTTPFAAEATNPPLHVVNLAAIGGPAEFVLPETPRVGYVVRIAVLGGGPGGTVTVRAANSGVIWDAADVEVPGNSSLQLVHRGDDQWITLSQAEPEEPEVPEEPFSLAPLTNVYYVDLASTAPEPDGSIAAPYPGLQAAIDASFLAGLVDGRKRATIIVAPGVYGSAQFPSDTEFMENNYDVDVTIQAMAKGTVLIDTLESTTPVMSFAASLVGIRLGAFVAGDVGASLPQVTLNLVDCTLHDLGDGLNVVGRVEALRTWFASDIAVADDSLEATDCTFSDVASISATNIVLRRSTVDGGTVVTNDMELDRSSVSNVALTGNLRASYSRFQLSCTGTVSATYCQTGGFESTGNASLSFCTVEGPIVVSSGDLVLSSAILKTISISVIGDARFEDIRRDGFLDSIAVSGSLTMDSFSYWQLNGSSVTAGVKGSPGGFGYTSIPIVVPAVAAGEVAYADGTLVGTTAEGAYLVNTPVNVNPSDDLEAAGPGGGLINARMAADNIVRCTFIGPLTGGTFNFVVSSCL